MLACSPARSALASASVRPISASVPPIAGRLSVASSVVSTSPRFVLASNRTVHRIMPALVVRHQRGQSVRGRQATCPRFLPLPPASPTADPAADPAPSHTCHRHPRPTESSRAEFVNGLLRPLPDRRPLLVVAHAGKALSGREAGSSWLWTARTVPPCASSRRSGQAARLGLAFPSRSRCMPLPSEEHSNTLNTTTADP